MRAFSPIDGSTVNIDSAGTTARVALSPYCDGVRIMNNGTATVWIRFGDVTVVSTTSNIPIGPGAREVMWFDNMPGIRTAPYVALIAAGATGKCYFTAGSGF